MSISVLVPVHNSSKTIRNTLDSVLAQTVPPDEVLVMDDGSTDMTPDILRSYGSRITVFSQSNRGVAYTRNILCERAQGDLLAFIDHDDIWHPRYLEVQRGLANDHPEAVGYFTWHENFRGYGPFDWGTVPTGAHYDAEVIDPLSFLRRYNRRTGAFASVSYLCIPKRVLGELGTQPFYEGLAGVDDSFLCTMLPLFGPVVFFPASLVAYRVTAGAQSMHRLEMFEKWVEVFSVLEDRYRSEARAELVHAFSLAYASKRRAYAKILMGAGQVRKARQEFLRSVHDCPRFSSMAKSLALWSLTFAPSRVQPKWPSRYRE